ncbi:TORTIFOLIA1-like protein 4 [Linum perenne]
MKRRIDDAPQFEGDWKVEVTISDSSFTGVDDDTSMKRRIDDAPQRRLTKTETRRALFGRNSDDKTAKSNGFKSGARVAPHDDNGNSIVVSSSVENHHKNQKDSEDLTLISNQLLQIERHQSSLLDLLQRFIGEFPKRDESSTHRNRAAIVAEIEVKIIDYGSTMRLERRRTELPVVFTEGDRC